MADPYSDTNAMRSFLPAHRIATTDPKLLTKIGINTAVSEQWLDTHCTLDDRSILLANRLHYTLRPMSPGYWNVHKFCKHHTHTAFFIPDFSNNCLPAFDLQLEDMTVIACKTTLEILHKSKTMSRLAQFHPQAVTPNMCIIAYSLGCRIAYRMACILHTAGIRTFLILIDGLIGHDDDSDERMKGLVPLCVQYLDGVCQSTGDVKLDKVIQTINNHDRLIIKELIQLPDSEPNTVLHIESVYLHPSNSHHGPKTLNCLRKLLPYMKFIEIPNCNHFNIIKHAYSDISRLIKVWQHSTQT